MAGSTLKLLHVGSLADDPASREADLSQELLNFVRHRHDGAYGGRNAEARTQKLCSSETQGESGVRPLPPHANEVQRAVTVLAMHRFVEPAIVGI